VSIYFVVCLAERRKKNSSKTKLNPFFWDDFDLADGKDGLKIKN
jgi:hypothetical protein